MITIAVTTIILFALGLSCIISASFVFYIMIGKIDEKMPEEKRIPYFFSFSYRYNLEKEGIVRHEYKRLYPKSRLFTLYVALLIFGFIMMVACAPGLSRVWVK